MLALGGLQRQQILPENEIIQIIKSFRLSAALASLLLISPYQGTCNFEERRSLMVIASFTQFFFFIGEVLTASC